MKRIVAALAVLVLASGAAQAGPVWPMQGQNPQRTGQSPFAGPTRPVLHWTYLTGGIYNSPAIGSDGTVYFGSQDNRLYAVNSSGGHRWTYHTGGGIYNSPAIGSDGTVYVGSLDNRFYAVNSAGMLRWSYSTGPISSASSPAIGSDGTIYVGSDYDVGSDYCQFYAFNSRGTCRWSYQMPGMSSGVPKSPAIGSDGTVYVGSMANRLYAFNLERGRQVVVQHRRPALRPVDRA